ncbi:MAG: ATP-dependent helicase [Bdellovibrionia bacterium]
MMDLRSGLNEPQREAVLTTEGPLLVLAGAGAGKTKMLTSRISYLIDSCRVPPAQILALTFTNKAAGEMKERVERILRVSESSALGSPEIGTFHSFCIRLLRRELPHTPFTRSFVIYDDSDQLSLIKSAMQKLSIDEKSFSPKAIQAKINRAKCDALGPDEISASPMDLFARQMKRVYEQYQKDLFANQALDFGEILCLTYRLLRDQPEVRQKYQRWYRYIHVDEYQDTNRAQYLLLSLLASPIHGGHQNICVVGDEDQSIYKWRGADIHNILDFEKDYPGAKIVKLEQNYRSTQTILKAAGVVIRNNQSRKDKTLWTENEPGSNLICAQLADERAEAEMTIAEIQRLALDQSRSFDEFAIFYRTNAQSRPFEDVLRREKIPYQIVGGLRFYDRKEIKDLLAYFKLIANLSDSVSCKRVINVPARGIGKTTLERLEDFWNSQTSSGSLSYWEALVSATQDKQVASAAVAKKLNGFVQMVQLFVQKQPELLLSELYHLILDETGYVRELKKEGTEEATARIENLEELNTLLLEFEEEILEKTQEQHRLEKKKELLFLFIEQTALASDVDQLSSDQSSVKLMTLHSSKGLEFPVVFMVGMEEGLFPSVKPWEETPEEDLEEERRLCYVGMTRARQVLYLMSATIRRIWGNISYQEPSRFLAEIPPECLEMRNGSAALGSRFSRLGSSRHWGGSESFEDSSKVIARIGPQGSVVRLSHRSEAATSDWVGRAMNHPEYGPGTIVSSEGSGEDQKVTIRFSGRQLKKFLLRYVSSYLE